MRNPKKSHELIRQNEQIVKKSQKHDANLQKNSVIYFQIGLIVCLLTVYGLFEMSFETTIPTYRDLPPLEEPLYVDVPVIKPKIPELVEPMEQQKSKPASNFKEVPDEMFTEPITKETIEPTDSEPVLDPLDVVVLKEPKEVIVPVNFVEQVPIYPGCEKSKNNQERRQCMSEKITKLIQRKFDTNIASDYGLSGKQKIDVQFTIDKTGCVTEVKTRSPHPKLDEEAARVINIIPEMTPGKQQNKNVGVIYSLPIIFQVQ
tara:strand:- start:38267 stop:39046 length:780 start_codon:yes stop_codon:yes gene_type:complete